MWWEWKQIKGELIKLVTIVKIIASRSVRHLIYPYSDSLEIPGELENHWLCCLKCEDQSKKKLYAKIDWVFICIDLCRNAMYIGNEGKNSYSIARQMDEIIVEISLCTCECDLWNLTCTLDLHSIKVYHVQRTKRSAERCKATRNYMIIDLLNELVIENFKKNQIFMDKRTVNL